MSADQEILKKMLQSKLFQYFSMAEIEIFYSLGHPLSVKTGQSIIKEGTEGSEFYWIKSGRVNISISSIENGKTIDLNLLRDGDIFGEMVLLGKNRRSANATAHSDCELVSWKCNDCFNFFEKDTHVGFRLMSNFSHILADRIQNMNMQMRNNNNTINNDVLKFLRST